MNPQSSGPQGGKHEDRKDLLNEITTGARGAERAEDYGILSEKLRQLADMLKPNESIGAFPLKGELTPARDAVLTVISQVLERGQISSVAFDTRGMKLAVTDQAQTLRVVSTTQKEDNGSALNTYTGNLKGTLNDLLTFSPEGDLLALRALKGGQRELQVVSLTRHGWFNNAKVVAELSGVDVGDFAYAKDGSFIAAGCSDASIKLINPKNGKVEASFRTDDAPSAIALSSDGGQILAIDRGLKDKHRMYLIDVVRNGNGCELKEGGKLELNESVTSALVSQDLSLIALALKGGKVMLCEINQSGKLALSTVAEVDAPASVYSMAFSPNGRALATGGQDSKLRIYDLSRSGDNGQPVEIASYQAQSWISDLRFSPDGTKLAVGLHEGKVHVFGVKDA